MKLFFKNILVLLAFVGFLVLMRVLPFREWLRPVFDYLEEAGGLGMILFVLLCVLLTALFVPVSVVVFSSGMLFGLGMGYLLASAVLLAGNSLGFFAGRHLWSRIRHWPMFRQRIFQAVRRAVEAEGNRLIAFLRMTPFFHFMTGNLFFGSLDLKFGPYLLFSYLGMIPGTLLVVYAGSVANRALEDESGSSVWNWIFFGLGLLVFGWVSWRITLATRGKLQSVDGLDGNDTTTER